MSSSRWTMRRRTKLFGALAAGAALAIALPALSQDAPQSLLPPGFGGAPAKPAPAAPTAQAPQGPAAAPVEPGGIAPPVAPNADEGIAVSSRALLPADIAKLAAAEGTPAEELPDAARRPP